MIGYQSCPGCWYSGAAHLDGCEEYAKDLEELAKQLRPAERPVAPAPTASARDEIINERCPMCAHSPVLKEAPGNGSRHKYFCHGCSKGFNDFCPDGSSKLEGVGQEAAEKLSIVPRRQAEIASIIDELIAGRLKP